MIKIQYSFNHLHPVAELSTISLITFIINSTEFLQSLASKKQTCQFIVVKDMKSHKNLPVIFFCVPHPYAWSWV